MRERFGQTLSPEFENLAFLTGWFMVRKAVANQVWLTGQKRDW